jgi:hypothetical protein
MFNRLFPQRVDNTFRGHKLGLWFFAVIVLLKLCLSLDAIFNGSFMARAGDGIPLGTFTPAGAQAVGSLYALWGLEHLMLCLPCLLALVRYRALIPCLYALLLLEQLTRKLIVLPFFPLSTIGPVRLAVRESPGISPIPYGFLALIVIGLALSLWGKDNLQVRE